MTKYFKATFANGDIRTRSSENSTYTHAHRNGSTLGFASSLDRALKASRGGEVVSVEEITSKDYRALKAAAAEARRN